MIRSLFAWALLCALTFSGWNPVRAGEEDEVDFQALAQIIKDMQKQIDEQDAQRASKAVKTFRDGAESERAALELFLECTYLIDFKNKGKSYVDFRRWKEKELDGLKESEAGVAYRVQLAWLVILMEAEQSRDDGAVCKKVLAFLDGLAANANKLKGHGEILRENVMQSVFAKAYEYDKRLSGERLGSSPLDFKKHYDGLILPLARAQGLDAIQSAWNKRIELEGAIAEAWSKEEEGRGKAEFEREMLPELQWSRDVDLAEHGAPRSSALKALIGHLRKNITHPKARTWLTELSELCSGWQRAEWGEETVEKAEPTGIQSVSRATQAEVLQKLVD